MGGLALAFSRGLDATNTVPSLPQVLLLWRGQDRLWNIKTMKIEQSDLRETVSTLGRVK